MFWNRKKSEESPDYGHCWHDHGRPGFDGITHESLFRCCYCGVTWGERSMQPDPTHGPYSGMEIPLPKPTGRCQIRTPVKRYR